MRAMKIASTVWLLLSLIACGGGGGGDGDKSPTTGPQQTRPDLSDVEPYDAESPYRTVLKECVTAERMEESCSLSVLPLIGREHAEPTVDDIMQRVVVSHPWMGERFREMLQWYLPEDIRQLLKSVTAIVIDDDVIPSYYSSLTGVIYIDPDYLWLSLAEKDTISDEEDSRSSFAWELQFYTLARYVMDNDYAFDYGSATETGPRPIGNLDMPLAAVLYHELAHANDRFPAWETAHIASDRSVVEEAWSREDMWVSTLLQETSPLASQMMAELAQVIYFGESATAKQKALSAETVGLEFAADGANDDYAYATNFEDVAMLFEETMLRYHFGVERDIAYTPVTQRSAPLCDDFVVSWGMRGRLGDPLVRERARLVADHILGAGALDDFWNGLEEPTPLVTGAGWCDNLDPATASPVGHAAASSFRASVRGPHDERVLEDLKPYRLGTEPQL